MLRDAATALTRDSNLLPQAAPPSTRIRTKPRNIQIPGDRGEIEWTPMPPRRSTKACAVSTRPTAQRAQVHRKCGAHIRIGCVIRPRNPAPPAQSSSSSPSPTASSTSVSTIPSGIWSTMIFSIAGAFTPSTISTCSPAATRARAHHKRHKTTRKHTVALAPRTRHVRPRCPPSLKKRKFGRDVSLNFASCSVTSAHTCGTQQV